MSEHPLPQLLWVLERLADSYYEAAQVRFVAGLVLLGIGTVLGLAMTTTRRRLWDNGYPTILGAALTVGLLGALGGGSALVIEGLQAMAGALYYAAQGVTP